MKKNFFLKFFLFTVIATLVTFTACKDYDDDISKLNSDLTALKADFVSKSDLNTLKTELDGKISALQSEITTLKGDLSKYATKPELDAAKADILSKTVTLETFNNFKTWVEGEITKLKADVAKAATKDELQALETLLNSKIADLRTDLAAHIANFDALKLVVDGHSAAIADIKGDLADQLALIKANEVEIDAVKDDLQEKYNALTDLIDALDLRVVSLEGRAGSLEDAVVAIKGRLDIAEGAIVDLIDAVAALDDRLEIVEGKVTNLESALITLDKKVDNLKIELKQDIADLKIELQDNIDALEGYTKGEFIRVDNLIVNVRTLIANRLSDITLAPNAYVGGIEAIDFTSLVYYPMLDDENAQIPHPNHNNTTYKKAYNNSTAKPSVASYKFDPRSFNLSNADYKYVDRKAIVRSTTASSLVAIEGTPVKKAADGTVNFTLRRLNAHSNTVAANDNNKSFIQLEATLKGAAVDANESGVVISAEQELVYDNILDWTNVRIADKNTLVSAGNGAHYPVTFDEAAASTKIWYEIPYDKVYDLLAKVATCEFSGSSHNNFVIEDYNLSYKFAVASSVYNVTEGSTVTNQQDWVELVNATDGTYKAKGHNKELIGRTPILKVELVDQAGNVVRRAFVKVKFVAEKTPDITVGESHDLVYKCNDTEAQFEITEQYIRDNVYRIITSGKETSMSHEEFWNTYDAATATTKVKKNGSNHTMTSVPQIVDGATGVGTATKKIVWDFTHGELGTIGVNGSQFVASVTVKNKLVSSEFPEYVTFQFTLNVTLPNVNLPAANKVENDQYWSKNADGEYVAYQVNINVPNSPTSPANQAQFSTSLPQAYTTYNVVTDGACVTSYYKVVDTYSNGVRDTYPNGTSKPLPGVGISGDNITLAKTGANSAAVKAALNSKLGLQASVAHIYVLENGEEITVNTFLVNFIRPVNLNMPSGVTVTDAQDNGDIASFQWNGLLTDWRQFPIVAPEWTSVEHSYSYWKYVYQPEYSWKDGHYVEVSAASLDVVMEEASFTIGSAPIELFKGTATYQVQKREWVWTSPFSGYWGSWTNSGAASNLVSEQMLTEDQVNTWLDFKHTELVANLPANTWSTQYQLVEVTAPNVTSEMVSTPGQVVEYSYVQSVTYVPAVYDWVPGEWVAAPHTPTAKPTFDGTSNGQVVGDWMWTTFSWSHPSWNAGQYWFYYGPFQSITANIAGVTTNLTYNGGQLPTSVTLTQVGNTVKYVNVGAPIAYSYEIYIPVSVNYGWGTVESVWTVTVNPVN